MDNERDYLGRQYAPSSPDMADLYPEGLYPRRADAADTAAGPDGVGPNGAGPDDEGPDGAGPAPADPAPAGDHAEPGLRRQLRVGTVVWGLALTVLAVLLLLANTVNLAVDPVLLVLCLTLGSGLALLAGGFLAAAGRARKR